MAVSIHYFKTHPEPFNALKAGYKVHEVRKDDRVTRPRPGDAVILQEWDPATGMYTGRELKRTVSDVTLPGTFGLPADIYAMSVLP